MTIMSSFPLVSFLITLMLVAAVRIHGQKPVKDTDNNPVEVGKKYFIQSLSDYGGTLLPYPLNPLSLSFCPLRITLQSGLLGGPPVGFAFIWSESNQTIVDTYSDVTIEFKANYWVMCSDHSKFWEYKESDSLETEILVGGKPKRTNSWFKIREVEASTYELITSTGTVGVKPGTWTSLSELVLTKDAYKTLRVKFHKVDDVTKATTTSTSRVDKLGLRLAME